MSKKTKITNDQILEWFFEHDIEWQNDLISDSNSDPSQETFFKYIKQRYSDSILKYLSKI